VWVRSSPTWMRRAMARAGAAVPGDAPSVRAALADAGGCRRIQQWRTRVMTRVFDKAVCAADCASRPVSATAGVSGLLSERNRLGWGGHAPHHRCESTAE